MATNKLAFDIIAQAIMLNNYDYFIGKIDHSIQKALSVMNTVDNQAVNVLKQGFSKLKTEMKNDFSQTPDKINRDIIEIKPIEKEKPKIEPSKTWMAYPHRKAFIQSVKSKAKEFLSYIDEIFGVLKAIKLRFKQFNLDKYAAMLKNMVVQSVKELS